MTSTDRALQRVYFFMKQTAPDESQAAQVLEAAVASDACDANLTAPIESVSAPATSDTGCTIVITPEQLKEAGLNGAVAANSPADSDGKLVDAPKLDHEVDNSSRIDTLLDSDVQLTTDGRLVKAANFLNVVATRFAADEQSERADASVNSADSFVPTREHPVVTDAVEEPPRVDSAMADTYNKAGASTPLEQGAQEISTIDAGTLPKLKQKQPMLLIATTTEKPAQINSSTSSPLKTTPLSVSAPEFIPFGPVRPPTLATAAAAAEFVPSAHMPANDAAPQHHRDPRRKHGPIENSTPFFEMRKTPDKGVGLFALKKIPVGTRIICEEALLKIPYNDVALTLEAYRRLPHKKKNIYNNLHAYAPKNLDFNKEILLNLGNVDDEKVLADHIKVLSIFAANDFVLADQEALGVFETASRINHSCIPNVHFSNNGELHSKETVHAARDIEEGEELLANYIGSRSNYWRTERRQEHLSDHYGFHCKCDACAGLVIDSDRRRETLAGVVWGLNEYKYHDQYTAAQHGNNPYYPASRLAALRQAEDAHSILRQEGLVTSELCRACRFVSDFALGVGQYEKALSYAFSELDIERNIFGKEVGDLKDLGLAAEQWIAAVQDRMDVDGVPMPGMRFWADWLEKKAMWYDLRKDQKKRAVAEKEHLAEEAAQQKKKERNLQKKQEKAERKLRGIEAQKKSVAEEKMKKEAKDEEDDVKETQGQHDEDKENVEEIMAASKKMPE